MRLTEWLPLVDEHTRLSTRRTCQRLETPVGTALSAMLPTGNSSRSCVFPSSHQQHTLLCSAHRIWAELHLRASNNLAPVLPQSLRCYLSSLHTSLIRLCCRHYDPISGL